MQVVEALATMLTILRTHPTQNVGVALLAILPVSVGGIAQRPVARGQVLRSDAAYGVLGLSAVAVDTTLGKDDRLRLRK